MAFKCDSLEKQDGMLVLGLLGALTSLIESFHCLGVEDMWILYLLNCRSHTLHDLAFEETVEVTAATAVKERIHSANQYF